MRTIRIKLYKFWELSESAQINAQKRLFSDFNRPSMSYTEERIKVTCEYMGHEFLQDGTLFTPPQKTVKQ